MKSYILKYSNLCKIFICIFLTLGCNLSVEGHFWPDNILPYVFLVLIIYMVKRLKLEKILEFDIRNIKKLYMISACIFALFCIIVQGLIFRIYINDTAVSFAKAGIKTVLSGLAAFVIFIESFCIFKNRNIKPESKTDSRISGWFLILSVVYFYYIRRLNSNISLYPLLLFGLIYILNCSGDIRCGQKLLLRNNVIIMVGAAFLALFETLGYMALNYQSFPDGLFKWLLLMLWGLFAWGLVFYYVLTALFCLFDRTDSLPAFFEKKMTQVSEKSEHTELGLSKSIIILVIAAIAARLLYFMNWFPALLSKDTYVQIRQALGLDPYSNHHPWLHTMLIKLFMSIGRLIFGGNTAGVALTAIMSLLVSVLLVCIILKYYQDKVPVKLWWVMAVIFVLEPIHCIYSVTIWKDVLFAYSMLAFCFLLIVMDEECKRYKKVKRFLWPLYIIVSFFFCFSRTNGLYAWIFTLPFLIWHYRKSLKPWLISTMICFILIGSYKGLVLPYFQVTEPDTVEALSIPLQQIAFVIKNGGELSEYDTTVINNIVDMEAMGEHYNAHISDPVKNLIRNTGDQGYITGNMPDFIRMYISVGLKNPTDYITAFLNQSRGYWYHKMSNYIYYKEGVHEYAGELGISRTSLFPEKLRVGFEAFMDKYCDIWHKFWSLALDTYTVWILLIYSLIKRRSCFYFMPVIGVFITLVIATPVNDEFRYAYGIYLVLPLLIMNSLSGFKTHGSKPD